MRLPKLSTLPHLQIMKKNILNRLVGRKHLFGYDHEKALFYLIEGSQKHHFGNLDRGFYLYKKGLQRRADKLYKSYLLNLIEFQQTDIVIDCGANYADLWLSLRGKIAEKNYITFEPGENEFLSICANASNATNNKKGLGNEDKLNKFYVNDADADSSFIEPLHFFDVIDVETVTLMSYCKANKIKSIKLLKLEAEGYEPEILEGAKAVLPIIDYVAIDGGHERGVALEETFSFQTNFLTRNGFEMIGVNFEWGRALFKRLS